MQPKEIVREPLPSGTLPLCSLQKNCIERSAIDAERELNGAKQRDLALTWLTAHVQGLLVCAYKLSVARYSVTIKTHRGSNRTTAIVL